MVLVRTSIVIRLYGYVHKPYKIPAFLTLRVFALELIRQRMIVKNEHFPSFRKPPYIKFPWAIIPFIIKNKASLPLI